MAKRYHRKHLHQAIAATCLAVSALPALTATPAWGVTNTITASTAGAYSLAAGDSLVVTNSGAISGGTTGVTVTGGVTAGSITNNGTIQGSNYGIYVGNGNSLDSITNGATGLIKGTNSTGVYLSNSTITGKITNAGTISGGQNGISINQSTVGTTGNMASAIENSGTISGGQRGISISNSSTINGSIVNNTGGLITGTNSAGIYVNSNSTVTGAIDNSGTIAGRSYGIYIGNGSTVDSITNQVGATIQAAPSGTAGIYLSSGHITHSITNSGTITGPAGVYAGGSTIGGDIVNNAGGQINGTNSAGISLSNSSVTGKITNAGTISGNQDGIFINNNSTVGTTGNVASAIENSGTISGGQYGILISNSSTIYGSIVNNAGGHITGTNSAGIYISRSTISGAIDNSGTIAGGYYGIYVGNSSTVASITNNSGGIIRATSTAAIYLTESTVTGSVANSGTITGPAGIYAVSSTIGGDIVNNAGGHITGTNSAAIFLSQSAVSGKITNAGTISGQQFGIKIQNNSTIGGDITNTGTIKGSASVGIYVNSNSTVTGSVVNNGTIQGGQTGIRIQNSAVNGEITNSGTIQGGNYAIYITNPTSPIVIANTGLLDGAVELADSTLNLDGTSGRVTGAVTGVGSTVNVNGTFTSESTFDVGTFNVANGGTFNMAHDVTVANGVHNSGILSVAAGNTVTINGDYTQNAGGIFQTGASSASNYGKLAVTGTADLTASNKIDVKVSPGDTLANGNVLTNVLSAGTLHAGALTVTDNSALWNFTATVNGNAIDLTAEQGMTFAQAVSAGGASPAAAGVAGALDAIQTAGATGDMQTVLNALGSLGTTTEVGQAVSQLMPGFAGSGGQVAMGVAGSSGSQVVHERMSGEHGLSSGEPLFRDRGLWAQPFYSWTDQSERKGVAGYNANSYGLAMGADGKVSDAWRLGAALSFAKGDVDGDAPITRANLDINTYQVSLYATDDLSEATTLNLQAAFGINDNDSSRQIQFGGLYRTASADYTSWHTLLDAELTHRYKVNEKTTLAPYLRAQYTYVHAEDYTETGAGAVNLHVDSEGEDSLVASVGGRAAYALTDKAKLTGHLGVGYDFLANQSSVTSTFAGGGPAFITKGLDPATFVMQGGLGFEMLATNGMTIAARYDIDGRQDYTNQVVSLKFKVPF